MRVDDFMDKYITVMVCSKQQEEEILSECENRSVCWISGEKPTTYSPSDAGAVKFPYEIAIFATDIGYGLGYSQRIGALSGYKGYRYLPISYKEFAGQI